MGNLYQLKFNNSIEPKTLWQKDKLLIMNNFLFCHDSKVICSIFASRRVWHVGTGWSKNQKCLQADWSDTCPWQAVWYDYLSYGGFTPFQHYFNYIMATLIHDPWVNKPETRLGNVPCPRALHHDRRAVDIKPVSNSRRKPLRIPDWND